MIFEMADTLPHRVSAPARNIATPNTRNVMLTKLSMTRMNDPKQPVLVHILYIILIAATNAYRKKKSFSDTKKMLSFYSLR